MCVWYMFMMSVIYYLRTYKSSIHLLQVKAMLHIGLNLYIVIIRFVHQQIANVLRLWTKGNVLRGHP